MLEIYILGYILGFILSIYIIATDDYSESGYSPFPKYIIVIAVFVGVGIMSIGSWVLVYFNYLELKIRKEEKCKN